MPLVLFSNLFPLHLFCTVQLEAYPEERLLRPYAMLSRAKYMGSSDIADTHFQTFRELYDWSVGDNRTDFWEDMWNSSGLIYEGSYSKVRPFTPILCLKPGVVVGES